MKTTKLPSVGAKFALLSIFVCILFSINDVYSINIKINNSDPEFRINENSYTKLSFTNTFSAFDFVKVNAKNGLFYELRVDMYNSTTSIGSPKLPVLKKLIEIPYGADIRVEVVSFSEKKYKLDDWGIDKYLMPLQAPLSKSHIGDIPFDFDAAVYNNDSFFGKKLVNVKKIGVLRGVNLARLNISPVSYNPVSKEIIVINDIEIIIHFDNADIVKTIDEKIRLKSPYFNAVNSQIVNFKQTSSTKDTITKYPVKYVIVSDPMFQSTLQSFINWKTKKGFTVIEAYTNNPVVGTTTTSIKAYLQSLYNAGTQADPAPSFVLFVGDVAQIPSNTGTQGSHVTDLPYCEYTGDFLPEIFYGRFSATNIGELSSQIDKTLEYEKYLMPNPSFLDTVVMISGVDGSFADVHGNGQINYGTSNYFNSAHNIYSNTYLYPLSGSSATQIIQDVNAGAGFVNYTAHGSSTGWVDPAFNVSDVQTLNNEGKYPLMIGNACVTNKFENNVCFGEALLRASKKGAVGYIGASNNTTWDEDFWWGVGSGNVVVNPTYAGTGLGGYDRAFHDHGEAFSDWFVTQGQMVYAGNLAVTQAASTSSMQYYWEIYNLMGDPSLMVYFSVPQALTANYLPTMPLGLSNFIINTEPYAYAAISVNGVLHGAALADANGFVDVAIVPITIPGNADIVITKQNRIPNIGTVLVAPPTGPYVLYNQYTIDDSAGNNNGIAECGDSIILNIDLENNTNFIANNVNASISSADTNISITNANASCGNINANNTITKSNAFALKVKDFIPDQHNVKFNLTVQDGPGSTWDYIFYVLLNAPELTVGTVTIDDNAGGNGDGRLDPGETANLIIETKNIGHFEAVNTIGNLICSNPLITINNSSYIHNNIVSGGNSVATFSVTVSNSVTLGSNLYFTYEAVSGYYNTQKSIVKMVGQVLEDFESGDFTKYLWNHNSTPWTITSQNPYEGQFCSKSGMINDMAVSELLIDLNVLTDDSISFFIKVSCEYGSQYGSKYDYLSFLIDNVEMDWWDGETDWTRKSFPVSGGAHQFKWKYSKDYNSSEGSDCAWLDYVVLPPINDGSDINEIENFDPELTVYPNPVNSTAVISYKINKTSFVNLDIYNTVGQKVKSLTNYKQIAGKHMLNISKDEIGSGMFFIVLKADNQAYTEKVIIR